MIKKLKENKEFVKQMQINRQTLVQINEEDDEGSVRGTIKKDKD